MSLFSHPQGIGRSCHLSMNQINKATIQHQLVSIGLSKLNIITSQIALIHTIRASNMSNLLHPQKSTQRQNTNQFSTFTNFQTIHMHTKIQFTKFKTNEKIKPFQQQYLKSQNKNQIITTKKKS